MTAYHGSICHTETKHCNDLEQLRNRRRHSEHAYNYHKEQGNTEESEFFRQDLELLNLRIEKIENDKNNEAATKENR